MSFLVEGQETVFAELTQTIQEGNALAFVGSGVSKDAGYPLWWELVEQLAHAAQLQLNPEDSEADGTRLVELVQQCKERLGEEAYYEELRRVFDSRLRPPFSQMHVQILEMPFVSFPTTNVDNCLVLAMQNIRQGRITPEWDVFPLLYTHKLTERRILYIHGKIEADDRIRSVVLSKGEYENAYNPNGGAAREFLLYALRRLDCVFIGYSMNDVFMSKVFEEAAAVLRQEQKELLQQGQMRIREPRHYALLPRHVRSDGRTYIPSGIARPISDEEIQRRGLQLIERESLLKRLRITPLYYRVVNDNHTTLNQLIYQLNRQLVTETMQVPN